MLSIVIPCYNEGLKLVDNIIKVNRYMDKLNIDYEIIVVNDGSRDNTYELLTENFDKFKNTRIETYSVNRGKGYAIKTGLLAARGELVAYMDADLSTDLKAIEDALALFKEYDYDLIIGNRRGENSKEENKNVLRKILSWGCHLVTKIVTGIDYIDTQCGFKVVKNDIAKDFANKQTIERFAFDIEYLYIALLNKYSVAELSVIWNDDKDSKVKVVRDTIRFMRDLIKIRSNKKIYKQ